MLLILKLLLKYKRKVLFYRVSRYIIVEDPIGTVRKEVADIIDFMVFIDTPLELALARMMLRNIDWQERLVLKDQEGKSKEELVHEMKTWVRKDLLEYLEETHSIYITVGKLVAEVSDLVLNGQLPVEDLAKNVVEKVKSKTEEI